MTSPMNEINNSNEFIATDNSHEELTAAAALAELVEGATAANQDCMDEDVASQCDDGDAFVFPQRFTKSGRQRAVPFPLKVGHSFCMCCGYLSGLSAPSPGDEVINEPPPVWGFPVPVNEELETFFAV